VTYVNGATYPEALGLRREGRLAASLTAARAAAGWATAALSGAADFSAGDALRIIIEVTSGTFAPTSNQALMHALLVFPVAGWV
jgi:hypothetical protein